MQTAHALNVSVSEEAVTIISKMEPV